MSESKMNYISAKLQTYGVFDQNTPERRAFAEHLQYVVRALREIERVEKGDEPDQIAESEAIRACLSNEKPLEAAIDMAHEASLQLQKELEIACSGNIKRERKYIHGE